MQTLPVREPRAASLPTQPSLPTLPPHTSLRGPIPLTRQYLITLKPTGSTAALRVLRGGRELGFELAVAPNDLLVPVSDGGVQ